MTTHASEILEHILELVPVGPIDHMLAQCPPLTVVERIDFILELHPHLVNRLREW